MTVNPDGTLKSIPNVKDAETDQALSQIREQGQSKAFKIMDHVPADTEGATGNIVLANSGGTWYICGKTTGPAPLWKKAIIT
jgi:hypothetical protein